MSNLHIAVIVGSLRKDSINRKLAKAIEMLAPADVTFKELNIGALPLYNQDNDGDETAAVRQFKADIESAQGVLFVTPEYNRSMPGVLKNALDVGSRPWGKTSWNGKPAGVLGASLGSIGTALAQQHLRNVLAYLNMPTLGQPEAFIHAKDGLFNADGSISASSKEFLQSWVDSYLAWVKKHQ